MKYANKIREDIEKLQLPHSGNSYKVVTISIGICFVDFAKHDIEIKEIYSNADKALYQSKENGRNVVSSWRVKG